MPVCCECCVLSGRGLCDELITRPGESYRLWCVVVCEEAMAHLGGGWCRAKNKQNIPMYLPFYNQLVFIYFGVN